MAKDNRLIVALDVPTGALALKWVKKLSPQVKTFKVGLQLYTAEGPKLIKRIQKAGGRVFLDLKLHDIPNTVAKAVESAREHHVDMLTLHTLGGLDMLKAAVKARGKSKKPLLLGVTILTSISPKVLKKELHVVKPVPEMVLALSGLAKYAGLDAVVASPLEAARIKKAYGQKLMIITPGIRPGNASLNDQKRVLTPGDALRAGSDYLVVGRPILESPDPLGTVNQILLEMKESGK